MTVSKIEFGAHCPTCGFPAGKNGWLRSEFPVESKYFGYIVRCPDCNTGENLIAKLRKTSQLTGWLMNANFDNLNISVGNKNAAGACKDIAYRGKKGWLVVYGVYGCGKTHLLAATINACVERKVPAIYFSLPGLLDRLRASYDNENYDEIMNRLEAVDVLAIDEFDIDKISAKPWVKEKIQILFDSRYREMSKRATLFAMQDVPKKYADNDPASAFNYIYSRMNDGRNQAIKITSGDYRPIQKDMPDYVA